MPASLLAALAAILLAIYPAIHYFDMVQDANNRSVVAVAGGQLETLLSGTKKYVRAHGTELLTSVPVGNDIALSLATLITEHDIPVGFTSINPYGQTWKVYIAQPVSGVLDAYVVSYNGLTLAPKDAVAVALRAGAQGGYVPPNGLISGLNSNMAVGASGTWSQTISSFPNPGAGHLVGLVASANDADDNPNYLYRDAIDGHPELNTMETALNMDGNDITSAGDIHAEGAISTGNDTDNKTANAYISKDGRINATKDIRGQIFRPNYVAQEGAACTDVTINTGAMDDVESNNTSDTFTVQTGDIARDATGQLLSCSDGVWTYPGSKFDHYDGEICGYNAWGQNTSNHTQLVMGHEMWSGQDTNIFVYVNGQNVVAQYSGAGSKGASMLGGTWILPPGASWSWSGVNTVCGWFYH